MKLLLAATMLLSVTTSPTPTPTPRVAEPSVSEEWVPLPPPLVPLWQNPWYTEIPPNEPLYEAAFQVAHYGLGTKYSRKRGVLGRPIPAKNVPVKAILDAAGGRWRE